MKIYSYCSYEGSPCGFVLGSFEFHTEAKDQQGLRFILQNDSVLPIIQTVFECGSVDFVFGNLPDKDTYWIVVKDLNAKDEKPYRYLNFAFETKNLREYQILLAGILNGYKQSFKANFAFFRLHCFKKRGHRIWTSNLCKCSTGILERMCQD